MGCSWANIKFSIFQHIDIPSTKNRSFRKIIAVYDIDNFNIKIIVKVFYYNKFRELVILLDSNAKEVRVIYSRMLEAERL